MASGKREAGSDKGMNGIFRNADWVECERLSTTKYNARNGAWEDHEIRFPQQWIELLIDSQWKPRRPCCSVPAANLRRRGTIGQCDTEGVDGRTERLHLPTACYKQ